MNALRVWLRKKLLTPAEHALLADYAAAARAFGEADLDRGAAQEWGAVLRTETGRRIDALMCDFIQQQAMQAITAPAAELARTCGRADGARAAWMMAKAISTMGTTHGASTEAQPDTAAARIDYLNP